MRIISGKFKGRILTPPKNLDLRPTTEVSKEALFNILNNIVYFEDIKVLDLFAGIGSITFEMISRGVIHVTSIENNYKCTSFLKQSAEKLNINNISIINSDVFKILPKLSNQFDLIFADPPYDIQNLDSIPNLIFNNNLLSDDGLFVLEHPNFYDFSDNKYFTDHRKYSRVNFSFFKNK